MPTTRNSVTIRAPVDTVWKVVGSLESVVRWVPGVTTCRLEGAIRICNGGESQEEISGYSVERRSYCFRHLRIPLPVVSSAGSFTVAGNGETTVTLEWSFEAADPSQEAAVGQMVDGAAKQTPARLRGLVEGQGNV